MKARLLLATSLVLFATALRVVPHPWNFTPVGAVALFSGACFDRKRWSFVIPLLAMFLGDAVIGFHSLMPVIYAAFAATVVMGILIKRVTPAAVAAGAVASATLFYIVTNSAMWTISTMYPRTLAGLAACYVAGIPFYGTMVFADLVYSAILFGTFAWAERRLPMFAPR
ncbi:MAG: DUF6580 family putative transport protein [Thermoanaerobaculia bacterium]